MEPTAFVFDINSHFNRIYSIKTKDGIPTHESAYRNGEPIFCLKPLIGIVNNEIKAMEKMGIFHTHIVLVFDTLGSNFRYDIFPDYKGTRPPKVFERRRQEEIMYDMFLALGIPCLRISNVEADDTIGTLVTKLSSKGIRSIVFTGDKDMMSLVNHNTSVYAGIKKKLYTEHDVKIRFNVPPARVIDFLALQGDSADNIKGVERVGEKTAALMLANFTLDEIVANPDVLMNSGIRGIKGIIKSLKEDVHNMSLMRELVTLKKDVKLGISLKDLVYQETDKSVFLNGFLTE